MILKKEIDQKAEEFEVHSSNIERDYVFGWMLNGIFTVSDLKDQVFLKGGNALRKGYFGNTRFSKDLDLGMLGDISQDKLLVEINKVCDYIHEKALVVFDKSENTVEEKFTNTEAPLPDLKVYEIRVYFADFYGKKSSMTLKISLDLTRFDKVLLPVQSIPLIHPYSDSDSIACNIRCVKLEEIIATKMKCLFQREHTPDLFDYVYSIKLLGGSLNKEEVVSTLIKKTIFARNPHVLKGILKNISLSFFREYWNKSIVCAKTSMIDVEDAIGQFLGDLEGLFSMYPDNGYAALAYFGSDVRTPIMKAGRTQTLLRIRYKGAERLVEPYALKYQQKRDGTEREYLYVYSVTGGESGPGVKSLIAENMSSAENTDIPFVPRSGFQIELCKSGELPENPYRFDPNKPAKREPSPRKRSGFYRSRSSGGIKYMYRCSTCGKKFTRSTTRGRTSVHKNKNGYQCYGYGVYEGTKY